MGIKLELSMTQNIRDERICVDYWAYDHKEDYLEHVQMLCQKYRINSNLLFETIAQCYACLDDVLCEYCTSACPVEMPADILYMRAQDSWCCMVCKNAVWQKDYV